MDNIDYFDSILKPGYSMEKEANKLRPKTRPLVVCSECEDPVLESETKELDGRYICFKCCGFSENEYGEGLRKARNRERLNQKATRISTQKRKKKNKLKKKNLKRKR